MLLLCRDIDMQLENHAIAVPQTFLKILQCISSFALTRRDGLQAVFAVDGCMIFDGPEHINTR
jgi:hypothetical protein